MQEPISLPKLFDASPVWESKSKYVISQYQDPPSILSWSLWPLTVGT